MLERIHDIGCKYNLSEVHPASSIADVTNTCIIGRYQSMLAPEDAADIAIGGATRYPGRYIR
jgi:hypothetical protein